MTKDFLSSFRKRRRPFWSRFGFVHILSLMTRAAVVDATCCLIALAICLIIASRWQKISDRLLPMRCIPVFSNASEGDAVTVPPVVPVWMFWNKLPLPETVQLCWKNWCYWCAKSEHIFAPTLVTDATVAQYIDLALHPCFDTATTYGQALRSDYIRLALLLRYGGVYLDASVIMTEPLDWILGRDKQGYGFFQATFNTENMTLGCNIPVIENSFLSAPPNHPLVVSWFERLLRVPDCSAASLNEIVKHTPKQSNLRTTYHFAYHAMTQILMEKPLSEQGAYNLYDSLQLKYLNFQLQSVDDLTQKHYKNAKYGPLLKLTARERKQLQKVLVKKKVVPGSFVDVFLLRIPAASIH
jgi:hypothetical protein